MRERIVIVFIAVAIGLIVTTLVFFLYQQTKSLPQGSSRIQSEEIISSENDILLTIEEPIDETLTDTRTIEVKGKTDKDNIIVVSTNQEDVIGEPTDEGDFSLSIDIDTGTNRIVIRSITPTGKSKEEVRIVTFNTEDF